MWGLSLLRSKLLVFVPLLLILGGIVVACGDDATLTPKATSPAPTGTSPAPTATKVAGFLLKAPEANPKYGGKLRVIHTQSLVHWDMQQAGSTTYSWVMHPTFDNLVRADPFSPGQSVVVPELATAWKISDDGLTYTFTLREGVKWHDGTPFTAEDVKISFDRIRNPPQQVFSVNKELFAAVTNIRVVDPLTVEFTLSAPRGLLLKLFTVPKTAVMQKKTLEANNLDLKKVRPIPGTGPWIMTDVELGEFNNYEKNPNYWNPNLPYLDEYIDRAFGWGPPTGAAFLAGQADVAMGVDPQTFEKLKDDPVKKTFRYPGTSPQHFVFNNKRPPFDDARVRRAVHLGLNTPGIRASAAEAINFGPAGWLLAGDAFHPEYWASVKDQKGWRSPTAEDIAEAKKLLADAGYAEGIKNVTFRGRDEAGSVLVLNTAQGLLKQVLGIETTLLLDTTGVHYEQIGKGDFDMAETGASQPMPFAHFLWSDLFGTDGPRNWSGYSNPEFDALIQKILAERDEAKLKDLILNEGMAILDRDVPVLMWGHEWVPFGWLSHVKGLGMVNGNTTDLEGRAKWDTAWLDQ